MRAILTVGLGFGDEGKGSIVDYLTRKHSADLVVRYNGGHQAGHNVQLENGQRHTFSQFGAGTFAGARTFLSRHVIVDPLAMVNELNHLIDCGLDGRALLDNLFVHEHALITTVYHRAMNRIRSRLFTKAHGTCGVGIGETVRYHLKYGMDAVRVSTIWHKLALADKMDLVRRRYREEIQRMNLDPEQMSRNIAELQLFEQPISDHVQQLWNAGREMDLSSRSVLDTPDFETAIFEGAQGVLLDEAYGFHPHTTWGTTTLTNAMEIIRDIGQPVDTEVIGIMRAYATRHGNGPFPSQDGEVDAHVNDPANPPNTWQGRLRCGFPDLVLLEYAKTVLEMQGTALNGVAVTCMDTATEFESFHVCESYMIDGVPVPNIPVFMVPRRNEMRHLAKKLKIAVPMFEPCDPDAFLEQVRDRIAPVTITSWGPDATSKKAEIVCT